MPDAGSPATHAEELAKVARRAARLAAAQDWQHALGAFADLERLADHAIRAAVHGARQAGWSWTRIGRDLGVTQQAAWRRFSSQTTPATIRHESSPEE
jgi:hypothetical protein